MISEELIENLEKQGYRIVGNHSAIKVCLWFKKALRDEDTCYKNKFYGIKSWQCVQMSPAFLNCLHLCSFCWRDLEYTIPEEVKEPDDPKFIIDKSTEEHKKILQGFRASKKLNKKKFEEAMKPKHFAISLSGDATMYPLLPEFIKELDCRKISSFLVTNGLKPGMLLKLIKQQPTQLYITLPACNENMYKKVCNPLMESGWWQLQKSLKLLKHFNRGTVRLTLYNNINMENAKGYANLLKDIGFKFLEVKAAFPVGYARHRLKYEDMPRHNEIIDFAKKIKENLNLEIIDEKKESRVVLLSKDNKDRMLE